MTGCLTGRGIVSLQCLLFDMKLAMHKPGLVTAPPTGQSEKISVTNTSCISDVPLCAVLDQFCIWFCLFCVPLSVLVASSPKLVQTQTKTKPHTYNYWILFSRKALTVLLAKTPDRKWVITLAKLLHIDTRFLFVSTPHRTSCTF